MKHLFTPFLVLVTLTTTIISRAEVINISVINNQFNPSTANVIVGDVVRFNFSAGFHNVTSKSGGGSVPAGASAVFSGDPTVGTRSYDYQVTQPGTYNYNCEVHVDFGMVGSFTASGSLPVTLASILLTESSNKKPTITWKTATEQNVAYFSVRSSIDGKKFSEIARVTAKGNSNSEEVYSYTDEKVSGEFRFVYYELVIVDKDQQLFYSPIKLFRTSFAASKLVVQLSPNPITKPGQLMIQFNAEKAGSMPVNVFDAAGKQVMKTTMTAMPGLNNAHLHVCDLPPGIYTLQFSYEGLRETKKIVVN